MIARRASEPDLRQKGARLSYFENARLVEKPTLIVIGISLLSYIGNCRFLYCNRSPSGNLIYLVYVKGGAETERPSNCRQDQDNCRTSRTHPICYLAKVH